MIKRNEDNEFEMALGPLRIHMKNAPKWGLILISIGIMFAVVIWAHARYVSSVRTERIKQIVTKYVKGTALTDKDAEFIETLTPEEESNMLKMVEKKNNIKIKLDGMELEQHPAPGTKTTIIKDGKKVSIEKGAANE